MIKESISQGTYLEYTQHSTLSVERERERDINDGPYTWNQPTGDPTMLIKASETYHFHSLRLDLSMIGGWRLDLYPTTHNCFLAGSLGPLSAGTKVIFAYHIPYCMMAEKDNHRGFQSKDEQKNKRTRGQEDNRASRG